MNGKFLSLVAVAIACISQVQSQSVPEPRSAPHPQSVQPQPHSSGEQVVNSGKPQDGYYYRSAQPSTGSQPTYQGYTGSNSPSTYGTSREASTGSNPIFGVSSNADFQLYAYFGQIIWGFLAVTLTLTVSIWIIRYFTGTDVVGGFVDKISNANGRAMDLDRITNFVYQAFDEFGKYAAKEGRHLESVKGR